MNAITDFTDFVADKVYIESFARLSPAQLYALLEAREAVYHFEQHITEPDLDGVDPDCTFLWIESDGVVAGCLRMIPPGRVYPEASIGRLLVVPPLRRQGLCRRMMNRALDYIAREWKCRAVRISAQAYLVDYYRTLGFAVVSDEYSDAGIPHYEMLLRWPP